MAMTFWWDSRLAPFGVGFGDESGEGLRGGEGGVQIKGL